MEVSHKETEWNKWSLRRVALLENHSRLWFLDVSNVWLRITFEWMSVEDRLDEDLKEMQVVFLIEMSYQIISNTGDTILIEMSIL